MKELFYEQQFLIALAITVAVETAALYLLLRFLYKIKSIPLSRIVLVGCIASGLTIPYLWFIVPVFIHDWLTSVIIGEIVVFLVEAIIYNRILELSISKSVVISLLANVSSIAVGLLVFY